MAALNVTQAGVTTAVQEFDAAASAAVHHEKISSSMAALSVPELLGLRGRRVHLVRFPGRAFECQLSAQVMAVVVPAPNAPIGASLLLFEDGESVDLMDYVDASELRLVAVE
ncbi:hypothetical protein ACEPTN_31735 [Pseudomonas aeruginosa]